MGEYHFLHGDIKNALQITQISLQDAKSINHLSANANNQRMLGRIYMRANQMEDALDSLKMAVSVHRYSGDVIGGPLSRIFLAKLYLRSGDPEPALNHLSEAIHRAEKFGLVVATGLARLSIAEAKMQSTGILEVDQLEKAWNHLQAAGYLRGLCDVHLLRIQSSVATGEFDAARQNLATLKERIGAVGSNEQKAETVYWEAIIDVEEGEIQKGSKKLIELQRLAKDTVFPELESRCKTRIDELRQSLREQSAVAQA